MARELAIDVDVNTGDADAVIARLALSLQKAGDTALVAAEKAEKFERAYRDGRARKQATAELDALHGATSRQAGVTDKLSAAVMRYAGPAVVLEAARRTIAWADNIDEMATRTRLSAEQVQQLTKVAEKNGSTFGAMAGLIQNAEQRLASHNKQAESAVRLMGMAPEALLRMDPLERLRAIAKGLADIEDPAEKSRLELALFGRSGDAAAAALEALAKGADKVETALGSSFIQAGAEAQDMLDSIKNKALDALRAIVLVGPALIVEARKLDAENKARGVVSSPGAFGGPFDQVIADRIRRETGQIMPGMPSIPGNPYAVFATGSPGLPSGYQVIGPGLVTGNGITLPGTSATSRGGGARVLPFRQNTFALGSTAASIFAMANTPGGFNAGSLPFASSFNFLSSSGSPISFANGSGFAPTVGMNAPGASGGGFGSWLSGHKTQLAGVGLGLMSRFIPQGGKIGSALNMAGQGASMGAMFGPWGMGIGAAAGGLLGLFTGGRAEKNARNAETSQVFSQFSTKEFQSLQAEAAKFGVSMDRALRATTMKEFGSAVDEVTEKLRELNDVQSQIDDLTEQSTVNFDKMDRVAKEFGLDISKLGPAFQQAAIDKESQRIIDAFAIMEKGGANINGVLSGMADEISGVVVDSLKFGTTIPANMRPWIEKLIESRELVDENGNLITDMSGLRFGDAMKSEMQKVVDKLGELIEKLGELTGQFRDAKGAAEDLAGVDYRVPEWGNPGGGGPEVVGMDSGGVAGRDFRRPSHRDVFPALLRRGERVLPPGATGAGLSLSIGQLTVGSGYGSRADAVDEIGSAVVSYLERRGARLVA